MPTRSDPASADLDALLARSRGPGSTPPSGTPEPSSTEPSHGFWMAVLGLSVLLGLIALQDHWVPNKWLFGDGAFYMNVARGILENRSLRQETMHPHSWYERDLGWNGSVDAAWSNIALGRHGEWWPKHPVLMPLCAVPFVWAFGPVGTLVFQFIAYALMGVFAYRVASRVASRPAALAAACAFVVTPWIYDRVWGFNNDVFYTVLILAAVDAALLKRAAWAGALLGIGIFAKNTNVLYAPALLLLFLARRDLRGALRLCLFAAVPTALYLGLNTYLFGSPLSTGYDRILVREAGRLTTHSHRADFHFAALKPGLERILFGGEGFLGKFPLLFPSAAGLLVMALRKRWSESLLFAWSIAVPIVFHAPYTWYRLEFNLPQAALCAAPLAALLPPFGKPWDGGDAGTRIRWDRIGPVALLLILACAGLGRRFLEPKHDYFWEHLPRASVFLGDIPCDYYNNQMERWECSHYDNDAFMTGRPLQPAVTYGGTKQELLLLAPHSSARDRRLEYSNVPMGKMLHLRFGLADSSRSEGRVHFKVLVDGQPVLEEDITEKTLTVRDIDTRSVAGRRARVELVVTSPNAAGVVFGVDGSPVP